MRKLIRFQLALGIALLCVIALGAPHASAAERVHLSTNWAGFESVEGNAYTVVSATWVVPEAEPSKSRTTSHAVWVGIGGAETSDLIQAGTHAITHNGKTVYHAWYETLPDPMRELPLAVSPGDTVSVSLKETT